LRDLELVLHGGSSTPSFKQIVAGKGKKPVEEDKDPSEEVRQRDKEEG